MPDYFPEVTLSNHPGQSGLDSPATMSLREHVGKQLRALRIARGLTTREAADGGPLKRAMLNHVELGQETTTIDKLEALVARLGGSIEVKIDQESDSDRDVAPTPDIGRKRQGLARRFLAILPFIPDEELDVFVHEVRLWEHRYRPEDR